MLHVFPTFTMYASEKWYFSTVSTCDLGIEMCFLVLEVSFLVEIVARVVGMKNFRIYHCTKCFCVVSSVPIDITWHSRRSGGVTTVTTAHWATGDNCSTSRELPRPRQAP